MNIQDTRNIIPSMEANTNFYIEKTYSEPWRISKMEIFRQSTTHVCLLNVIVLDIFEVKNKVSRITSGVLIENFELLMASVIIFKIFFTSLLP